ncbi:Protein zds1 [Psilocybe cubensis]|uniref:Protein Zds1 C-terminal domain-containing protein n=2 Tax=Psilocybe cubensis TaxID=181762 RepID=A0A8H7XTB8_PSICU|nr:Protein zds1 [Psilocybe cubensis]KAH9479453.1 Protein zds1 [Psilocybe cubensis]
MSSRPLQPSEYEIQREVEALRDLRRRSTTPGALTIDPDLPNQSPPSSPTAQYWVGKTPAASAPSPDSNFINSNVQGLPSPDPATSPGSSRTADPAPNNPSDDPLHLFWVPASLHPEIAPAEFRAFLKEHARSPPDGQPTSPSSLSSSSSLNRKRSMLSRQYRPQENDGVEEENIVPLKRNRSLMYPTNPGPQLTISDLQKLEELAEEASESDDPSRLRSVLRRSLSLNISPSAIMMDEVPDMGDEADAPIIVPPPGQILRRAARTKIRKPGLPGDGGGHRFGASRRGANANNTPPVPSEPRTSSDISSSDHGDSDYSSVLRRPTISDDSSHHNARPDSYSEETSIYDAYARDDEDEVNIPVVPDTAASPPPAPPMQLEPIPIPVEEPPQRPIDAIPFHQETPPAVIHQPQPQRLAVPQPTQEPSTSSRTPSPSEAANGRLIPVQSSPPAIPQSIPPQVRKEKEKDKKGLFSKWGGDKGGKKGQKEKDREGRDRVNSEKEKESGFFGSLFGKKKQDTDYQSSMTGGTSGREAAQALLGASKSSKSYVPPTSPGLAPGIGGNPYARYPIHVERAIYRLSHIKLANPRRPLYEQVLISNLMFWYLGVINKAQNPSTSPTQSVANGTQNSGNGDNREDAEQEEREREQREREAKEKEQREKAEKERLEREQREREREMELKKKESGRRGPLTKTPTGGQPGTRRAETPIKGPQYEMQHRVMEQEYGGYNGQPTRSSTAPIPMLNGAQSYQRVQQPGPYTNSPPKLVQPQVKAQPEQYYYQAPTDPHHRPGLPPGAMAPADQSNWISQPSSPTHHMHQSNPSNVNAHRRSRSPPSNQRQQQQHSYSPKSSPMQLHKLNTSQESLGDRSQGHKSPGRSLSATAYTSPPLASANGNLRKGHSAHATTPYEKRPRSSEGRSQRGEEEDVPLAVWQQQQRR